MAFCLSDSRTLLWLFILLSRYYSAHCGEPELVDSELLQLLPMAWLFHCSCCFPSFSVAELLFINALLLRWVYRPLLPCCKSDRPVRPFLRGSDSVTAYIYQPAPSYSLSAKRVNSWQGRPAMIQTSVPRPSTSNVNARSLARLYTFGIDVGGRLVRVSKWVADMPTAARSLGFEIWAACQVL